MCTPTGRTRPRRRDALRTVAKLYLRGGTTLRLAGEADYEAVKNAIEYGNPHAVEVTLTTGEQVTVAMRSIKSVVDTTTRAKRVKIDSGIFLGRRIELRALSVYNRDERNADGVPIPGIANEDQCVVVLGEDLAESPLVVVNLCDEKVVWTNPASIPANSERYLQATLLLAEAETLECTEGESAPAETGTLESDSPTEPGFQAEANPLDVQIGDRVEVVEGPQSDATGVVDDIIDGVPFVKLDNGPALSIPADALAKLD